MVSNNTTFNSIKTNVQWLETNADKTYSLKLNDFKKQQQEMKAVFKNLDTLYKLQTPLNIRNLNADLSVVNSSREREDRNKDFMTRLSRDIFLDKSIQVMDCLLYTSPSPRD